MYDCRELVRKHLFFGGHDDPASAPPHVRAALHQHDRHLDVERTKYVDDKTAGAWLNAHAEIVERMGTMAARRDAERDVADYIETKILNDHWDPKLARLADAMKSCRESGVYGLYTVDNRPVMAWDAKCGCSKLCPHEAREETKRLSAHYLPLLMDQIDKGNRVYYAVLTLPNFRRGELHDAKREIFRRWSALCKKTERRGRDCDGKTVRTKVFPEILGSLCAVEDPYAWNGTWNVHLNVILVTSNAGIRYDKLREHWGGFWIHLQSMKDMREKTERRLRRRGEDTSKLATRDILQHALLECIKYPVQSVAEKSARKAGQNGAWHSDLLGDDIYTGADGKHRAPPLVDWPPEAFLEWWMANQQYRRVRSYGKGVLFGFTVDKPPNTDMQQVQWIGEQRFRRDGSWIVTEPDLSLITGDNSEPDHTLKPGDRPPPDGSPEAHAYWLGQVRLSDYLKKRQHGVH